MTDQSLRAKAEAATPIFNAFIEAANPAAVLDLLDRLESYRRLLDEAGKALEPFAEAMRKHDDPGVSDLYDEQPIGWAKLGDFRRARAVQASIRAATEPMEM